MNSINECKIKRAALINAADFCGRIIRYYVQKQPEHRFCLQFMDELKRKKI